MKDALTELSDHDFQMFQRLIYQSAGVVLSDVKKPLVVGRLSGRLRQLNLPDFAAYYRYVSRGDDEAEKQRLIDLLTTHETYFFREEQHFHWLAQWLRAGHVRAPRLWSAACSSGEEVWTMAMVLADVLGFESTWSVFGSDVSVAMVAQAEMAHYDEARVRGLPDAYKKKYCLKGVGQQQGTFLIDRRLRDHASFQVMNLLQAQPQVAAMDVIFLRNVMIYFDMPTKKRVIEHLLGRLKPEGYLIVGHSESLNGLVSGLTTVRPTIYTRVRC